MIGGGVGWGWGGGNDGVQRFRAVVAGCGRARAALARGALPMGGCDAAYAFNWPLLPPNGCAAATWKGARGIANDERSAALGARAPALTCGAGYP
jgi:hypothetical protein